MAFISHIFSLLRNEINIPKPGYALGIIIFISISNISAQSDSIVLKPKIHHGSKGMHFETADGNNALDIDLRLQFRYSYPFEKDPLTLEDFNSQEQHIMQIRRASVSLLYDER